MIDFFEQFLLGYGISGNMSTYISKGIGVLIIITLSILTDIITRKFLLQALKLYIKKSRNKWDDKFIERKVFERLSYIAPAIVIHGFAPIFPGYQGLI